MLVIHNRIRQWRVEALLSWSPQLLFKVERENHCQENFENSLQVDIKSIATSTRPKYLAHPTMSSRPSRISQPSAKLNDPSNEADLPLKSHRDFVEKARAAELEKAHSSTVSAPPPQPRSPRAASVEDDHDDEFQPDLEVSNGSEVPTNNHPRAFSDESDHEAGDINNTIPATAKRPRATFDESDNEAGDITDDIPAKVKGQRKRKKQKTQTGELIFSLFMKPEPNLFCGDKVTLYLDWTYYLRQCF